MANEPGLVVSKLWNSKDLDTGVGDTRTAEIELVRRSQAGDSDAFADLVRAYQRRAVSLAFRLLGNAEDAGDVSQDAFVRAYRNLEQLEDPARFGPWLMRIVGNLSLNFRRSRGARRAVSLDDLSAGGLVARRPTTGRPLASADEASGGALSEELHTAITDALRRLPDKQRLALILFSVEGMPQREVAEVLECSVELVKWNVFQARKKLKGMLESFL